jgi:hypothetical protein
MGGVEPNMVHYDRNDLHRHTGYIDTPLIPEWPLADLPGITLTPSVPSPAPTSHRAAHRTHPYRSVSTPYLNRSCDPQSGPLHRTLSSGHSPRIVPADPVLPQPPTMNYLMPYPIPNLTVDNFNATPSNFYSPRRVPVMQTSALSRRSAKSAKYTVTFHTFGVPGFRMGDVLLNKHTMRDQFYVDGGEDIVLADCSDRKVHFSVDVSCSLSAPHISACADVVYL